jgi:hypothetical protein
VAEKDYYSFEEVLRNLKLEEDELKRLVSAGEIRAFRDKDTMRFKAEDVDRLKGGGGDDLVLDDDLELDLDEPAPAPRASAPPAVEELDLGGSDELVLDETVAEAEVEELELANEEPGEPETVTVTKARGRGATPAAAAAAASAAGAAAGRRAARAAEPVEEEGQEGMGVRIALVVGVLILICANFVVLDALSGHASNPISKMLSNLF